MTLWNQFLWVIFPYLALATFLVGHVYRYAMDRFGWTAKSSEFLEKKWLKLGSSLFHWGILLVLGGHAGGLLVPIRVYESLGVSEEAYHLVAIVMGGLSGAAALAGLLILVLRRLLVTPVRRTSSLPDLVALGMLLLVVGLGMANTLGYNLLYGSYEYRVTLGPWFRSLFTFTPDAALVTGLPITFKLHTLAAFALLGIWPFTRLVHVWSVPIEYLGRVPILMRARNPQQAGGR